MHDDVCERLLGQRVRLWMVRALAIHGSLTFKELKCLVRTTDGNLSVHARKLEDAAYVTCIKSFEGRYPKTEYRLTTVGREAFDRYAGRFAPPPSLEESPR